MTTREFDIDDDQMLIFTITNVKDFAVDMQSFEVYNQKIYNNKNN